ncbi:hypothetical protein D9619_002312 [Psilocybe cf. subviscida]|uniref:Rho-GAP domain-containing protein n=1 Tax=Psilocybe cf. subviscida TaxID=2480587 RepID=A0A8H5AVV7_9AGAR|nr:hypothetical protein D9619_002312 [Psilocybe cf. subviscida]
MSLFSPLRSAGQTRFASVRKQLKYMHPPRNQPPPTTPPSMDLLRNPGEPALAQSSMYLCPPEDGQVPKAGGITALKVKKKTYHGPTQSSVAEAAPRNTATVSTSSRRHASMPQSRSAPSFSAQQARTPVDEYGSGTPSSSSSSSLSPPPAPIASSLNQAQIDIANDRRARAHARGSLLPNPDSPPLVDFTRFEDTYRGPRSGTFEGLVPGAKTRQRSVSGGCCRPDGANPEAIKMKDRYPAITPTRPRGAGPYHEHLASTPALVPVTSHGGLAPAPASARKPDPRRVLSALEGMLGDEYKISDYLHSHELLGMHQLDQLDFEERDRARAMFLKTGKLNVRRGEKGVISVLGEPIRAASIYSSVPVVLSGREHEIPIVVVNTVEELYRTGIYQANLFRRLPNRGRLMELINIYDSEEQAPGGVIRPRQPSCASTGARTIGGRGGGRGDTEKTIHPGFGAMTSLHLESTPDVCALLTTYISSLREPILCRFLFAAIWDWCGVSDELETEEHGPAAGHPMSSFAPRLSSIPLARTYTSPEDASRIATAQLLLHLLPSPHFSLLVYLLAFFSQVALVREENGVGVADLARMYGARIFGGDSFPAKNTDSAHVSQGRTHTGDGETMMRWFLRRWGPLSDGLFDALEDASMGLFRRTHARRDSFGKDILSSWSSINGSDAAKGGEDEGDAESVQHNDDTDDEEHEAESVLDSLTPVRDRAFGKKSAKATTADDYFVAGFDTGDTNETRSPRSKVLRAHSISDQSLDYLGANATCCEGSDDFVVLSAADNQVDDMLSILRLPLASRGQMKDSRTSEGSNEYLLGDGMSKRTNENMSFISGEPSGQLLELPIPEIIVNSATPPTQTSPPVQSPRPDTALALVSEAICKNNAFPRSRRSTIIAAPRPNRDDDIVNAKAESELQGALETISKLREDNATLHNSVWRLEAELAQVRRDFYAASSSSSGASTATVDGSKRVLSAAIGGAERQAKDDDLNVEDAEAVKIVAEIRRLMAKN